MAKPNIHEIPVSRTGKTLTVDIEALPKQTRDDLIKRAITQLVNDYICQYPKESAETIRFQQATFRLEQLKLGLISLKPTK